MLKLNTVVRNGAISYE